MNQNKFKRTVCTDSNLKSSRMLHITSNRPQFIKAILDSDKNKYRTFTTLCSCGKKIIRHRIGETINNSGLCRICRNKLKKGNKLTLNCEFTIKEKVTLPIGTKIRVSISSIKGVRVVNHQIEYPPPHNR